MNAPRENTAHLARKCANVKTVAIAMLRLDLVDVFLAGPETFAMKLAQKTNLVLTAGIHVCAKIMEHAIQSQDVVNAKMVFLDIHASMNAHRVYMVRTVSDSVIVSAMQPVIM